MSCCVSCSPFNFQYHAANSPLLLSHIALKPRRGEFLNLSTEFMLGDHIPYSHDVSNSKAIDSTKRNLTLITRVKGLIRVSTSFYNKPLMPVSLNIRIAWKGSSVSCTFKRLETARLRFAITRSGKSLV